MDYVTKGEFNEFKGEMYDFRDRAEDHFASIEGHFTDVEKRLNSIDRRFDELKDEFRIQTGILVEQMQDERKITLEHVNGLVQNWQKR